MESRYSFTFSEAISHPDTIEKSIYGEFKVIIAFKYRPINKYDEVNAKYRIENMLLDLFKELSQAGIKVTSNAPY